jgi:hypothetical protein
LRNDGELHVRPQLSLRNGGRLLLPHDEWMQHDVVGRLRLRLRELHVRTGRCILVRRKYARTLHVRTRTVQ